MLFPLCRRVCCCCLFEDYLGIRVMLSLHTYSLIVLDYIFSFIAIQLGCWITYAVPMDPAPLDVLLIRLVDVYTSLSLRQRLRCCLIPLAVRCPKGTEKVFSSNTPIVTRNDLKPTTSKRRRIARRSFFVMVVCYQREEQKSYLWKTIWCKMRFSLQIVSAWARPARLNVATGVN